MKINAKGNKENTPLFESFKKECKVLNLEAEYPGLKGKEKYMILSDSDISIIEQKYGAIIDEYRPFVFAPMSISDVIKEFERNESKFAKRNERNTVSMGFFEEDEHRCKGLWEDDYITFCVKEKERKEEFKKLHRVMRMLGKKQRRRLIFSAVYGMSHDEIAQKEGVSRQMITKSIDCAKQTIRAYLKKDNNEIHQKGDKHAENQ